MKIALNLLPPKQKKVLRTQFVFRTILDQQIMVLLFLMVLVMSLLGLYAIVTSENTRLTAVNQELESQEDYSEILELHELFGETNTKVRTIAAVQAQHISWEGVLQLLNATVPRDIVLSLISTSDVAVTITGQAKQVESLVAFRDALTLVERDGVQCFEDVDVADKFLVATEDVTFDLTFRINVDGCMKK